MKRIFFRLDINIFISLILVILSYEVNAEIINKFAFYDGISFMQKEWSSELPTDIEHGKVTLYGQVWDDGINERFIVTYYDEKDIYKISFELNKKFNYGQYVSKWLKISGKSGKKKKDNFGYYYEFDIESYNDFSFKNEELVSISEMVSDWVEKYRKLIDLNEFKNSSLMSKFPHLKNIDFNKEKYYKANSINFTDYHNKLIGIICGNTDLYQSSQKIDGLRFWGIYDLNKKEIIKVYIIKTGGFLE